MKEKRKGGHFTVRVHREAENVDDIREIIQRLSENACTPQDHLSWWIETCRDTLATRGFADSSKHKFEEPSYESYMLQIAETGEKALSAASAESWWRAIDLAMRFARTVKEFEVWDSQQHSGSHAGKAKAKRYMERDVRLAREYEKQEAANKRLPGSARRSPTAMKEAIGKEVGLRRSAAIAAIDRGLKKSSSLQRKPDA